MEYRLRLLFSRSRPAAAVGIALLMSFCSDRRIVINPLVRGQIQAPLEFSLGPTSADSGTSPDGDIYEFPGLLSTSLDYFPSTVSCSVFSSSISDETRLIRLLLRLEE